MGSRRWKRNRRLKCVCAGYHFPHRRGGGACEHSTRHDFYAAKRSGLPLRECQELLSANDLERMFPL
jgi:hypothetical protein